MLTFHGNEDSYEGLAAAKPRVELALELVGSLDIDFAEFRQRKDIAPELASIADNLGLANLADDLGLANLDDLGLANLDDLGLANLADDLVGTIADSPDFP